MRCSRLVNKRCNDEDVALERCMTGIFLIIHCIIFSFPFLLSFFLPEPLSLLELFHSINTSDTVHKPQIASVGLWVWRKWGCSEGLRTSRGQSTLCAGCGKTQKISASCQRWLLPFPAVVWDALLSNLGKTNPTHRFTSLYTAWAFTFKFKAALSFIWHHKIFM